MDENLRERIAIFRYGVISELASRPLAPGDKETLLAEIAQKEWDIPGTHRRLIARSTARDWVEAYQRYGFDGLKPSQRSDRGTSRSLSDEVQELLVQLREERP